MNFWYAYTAAGNFKVVHYAEENGNWAAGLEFDINKANIRILWILRKRNFNLEKMPQSK